MYASFFDELAKIAEQDDAYVQELMRTRPSNLKRMEEARRVWEALERDMAKRGEHSPYGRQLLMGRKVEREHKDTVGWLKKNPDATLDQATTSIASDHLGEDRKYYTHLKEMEDKYKQKKASAWGKMVQALRRARKQGIVDLPGDPMAKASVFADEQTEETSVPGHGGSEGRSAR